MGSPMCARSSAQQREAIVLYQEFGAWSKVADALGVTRGAVSLRQRAAGLVALQACLSLPG